MFSVRRVVCSFEQLNTVFLREHLTNYKTNDYAFAVNDMNTFMLTNSCQQTLILRFPLTREHPLQRVVPLIDRSEKQLRCHMVRI